MAPPTATSSATPTVTRRRVLGATAAGLGASLTTIPSAAAQAAGDDDAVLDVSIFQTRELTNDAKTADTDDDIARVGDGYHPARVAAAHTTHAFEPLVAASDQYDRLRVTVDTRPIDLELRGTESIVRLLEWNGMLSRMEGTATHSNLLVDTQYAAVPVIGVALLNRAAGQDAVENNACILDFGQDLLDLPADPTAIPEESPVVVKDELVGNPAFIASAAPHEVGHTVMAEHGGGMAWKDEDLQRVATSIMMGAYILEQGGEDNNCGRELPEVTTEDGTFVDDIYVRNEFAPCVAKHFLDNAYDPTPGVGGAERPDTGVVDRGLPVGETVEAPDWARVHDISALGPFADRFLARYHTE